MTFTIGKPYSESDDKLSGYECYILFTREDGQEFAEQFRFRERPDQETLDRAIEDRKAVLQPEAAGGGKGPEPEPQPDPKATLESEWSKVQPALQEYLGKVLPDYRKAETRDQADLRAHDPILDSVLKTIGE